MNAISYSAARANLAETIDKVCDDHNPVIITKKRSASVVMMSLEDYEAMEETAYLLRNPANAKRLLQSMEEADKGNLIHKTIEELVALENA
jgi:antitoxin YefM